MGSQGEGYLGIVEYLVGSLQLSEDLGFNLLE